MTTSEFGDKYLNADILEIFDDTCEFFSTKLPQDFFDEYDVGEVILETKGHQETAKNFDNVIKFTHILQNKQPELYKEYFQYFDDFLIDFYCFHKDEPKVINAFSLFLDNPLHDYDKYLLGFKKLLFYQYSDLLQQCISKNFQTIAQSDDLIGNAALDLAMVKFYMALQDVFLSQEVTLNKSSLTAALATYGFDFKDDFLSNLDRGLLQPQLDASELTALFKRRKESFVIVVHGYFMRYMHQKGFAFYLSGGIWDKLLGYWQENDRSSTKTDSYFRIQADSFEKYILKLSSDLFLDNKPEMIAVLWGSVYVYEFLYKCGVISDVVFHGFMDITRKLKGKVIGRFTPDLWSSNFVHSWEKPECISEAEFVEENNIFKKSITFKYQPFSMLRGSISDELSKIGDLASFIEEGGEEAREMFDMIKLEKLFGSGNERLGSPDSFYNKTEPIRVEKNVGRNDPCPCGSGKKYKKCCGA
jgi:hypothetical protein